MLNSPMDFYKTFVQLVNKIISSKNTIDKLSKLDKLNKVLPDLKQLKKICKCKHCDGVEKTGILIMLILRAREAYIWTRNPNSEELTEVYRLFCDLFKTMKKYNTSEF